MKSTFRLALSLFVLLSAILPAVGMTEFRGLYVDAFHPGIKNHEQVTEMVRAAKAANFNALIVQVRKRGDAYYNSTIEPKALDIAPDYDPLADVIEQAHAVGMEVHAWLSVYEIALNSQWFQRAENHVSLTHPEWLMSDSEGNTVLANAKIYLDPGVPAVQAYLFSIVEEITRKYSVDGIHLDSVRYPNLAYGYNRLSVAAFNESTQIVGVPSSNLPQWQQWRRDQITLLVQAMHSRINAIRPGTDLSASVVSGNAAFASERYLQQWEAWMSAGLVDFVVPMLYIKADVMSEYAAEPVASAHQRHVYIGLGSYQISASLLSKQVADCRSAGMKGIVLYSYDRLNISDPQSATVRMDDLTASVFGDAAEVPQMSWKQ